MADEDERGAKRLLLVARRFWPHMDDAAGRVAALACDFQAAGWEPTILTPRYAASWPNELTFQEYQVLRPITAPRGDWSGALYHRALTRWLREQAHRYTLVYADNMRDEGAITVDVGRRSGVPVIVRCSGSGQASDLHWADEGRSHRRALRQSMEASAIIASDAAAARGLISGGAARERVHRIDDGIPLPLRRDRQSCAAARLALAEINRDLRVPEEGRVILVAGRMDNRSGMHTVAQAVASLLNDRPEWRVWFIGDGPSREALHRQLCDLSIRDLAAMPGSFGSVEELELAANLYVVASGNDSLEYRVPRAIAAGLPLVVVNTEATRTRLGPWKNQITWYDEEDSSSAQHAFESIACDLANAERNAIKLRTQMREQQSREDSLKQLFRLCTALTESPRELPSSFISERDA